MQEINIKRYKCQTCGHDYGSAEAAVKCEKKPVSQDKGVKIGDIVIVTKGEGQSQKAKVDSRFVFSMEWGHYAWEQYWHTVGLTAQLCDDTGSRQLTFDSYEPLNSTSSDNVGDQR